MTASSERTKIRIIRKLYIRDRIVSAEQWKLLGQERDGSLLVGWIEESYAGDEPMRSYSVIGHYDRILDSLQVGAPS